MRINSRDMPLRTVRETPRAVTTIAILDYPGAFQTAVHGIREMFWLAGRLRDKTGSGETIRCEAIPPPPDASGELANAPWTTLVVPPGLTAEYCLRPAPGTLEWLRKVHASGTVICSVCAGTFLLAEAGLLDGRSATTHWGLAREFRARFPRVRLLDAEILVDLGDVVTAGGLMSWMDLGLELAARFLSPAAMRELGKHLVVDTAKREQRFYRVFTPPFDHGDADVVRIQHRLHADLETKRSVARLAEEAGMCPRTLLRRFTRATGFTPIRYLQQLRIRNGRELLETTDDTVDSIARRSGYEEVGAFRKTFVDLIGLTPKAFRQRFRGTRDRPDTFQAGT